VTKATLSKLDNPKDTRTIIRSVESFMALRLANTENNTRKLEQIKKEEAKLRWPLYGLWRWIC
jgi:hypothetical protein